uniref:Uncharacterized protein n=1 Tax=Anguilla anguilla TaxID=7936 RepID=A0A0E9UN82_ANGAN
MQCLHMISCCCCFLQTASTYILLFMHGSPPLLI